ncbi:uncharacterized protein [Diabrotica undecimpunctata]|uniref:uncharacterized protein n=1 Tax=Diabrotica undecimpunctata TaxID=50387 RepID=UPI003B632E68
MELNSDGRGNPPDRGRIDDVASNMDYEVNEKQKQFEEIINIDINTQSKQVPITNSKNFLPDYQSGVIKGVDKNISENELKDIIVPRYGNFKVINVKRIKRKENDQLVETGTIVVSFRGQMIPKQVIIERMIYQVEPYVPRVIQCLNCIRYGHVTSQCRGKKRCSKCGQEHDSDVCDLTDPTCILCFGNHSALDRNKCAEFEKQKGIKYIMANENLPFEEAKLKYSSSYRTVLNSTNTGNRYTVTTKRKWSEGAQNKSVYPYSKEHENILDTASASAYPSLPIINNPLYQNQTKIVQQNSLTRGDFNCHNKMWGCDVTDQEGLYLFEAMEECGLNFLNDGSETLIRRPMNLNRSAIDLTICSRDIYYKFNWHTETLSLGSDHYPIVIEFNHYTDNNVTNSNDVIETNDISRSRITWDIKKADWAFFTYLLNNEKNNNISDGSEQEYSTFCDSINLASKCSIPERKRGPNAKFNKPWWNDDFVNEWTDIFFNKIARPWVIEGEINHRNPTDNRHENDEANTDNIFLTQAFSLEELKNCLKRHNNSAPGLDGIHYSMLYNLPIHKKVQLLNVINNIWMSMDIPRAWKEYIIVPILKPHKSPNCPDSYRGISLSSCVLKTMERMIKCRLEFWLEKNSKIPATQFGFRKSCSTMENLTHLILDIYNSFSVNKSVFATFIDIENAYDNVNLQLLYHKMKEIGLPDILCWKLHQLYINRTLYLQINNKLIGPRVSNIGLPQGSILSPILYTIYTAHIGQSIITSKQGKILQFADDICIYVDQLEIEQGSSKINTVFKHLQEDLDRIALNISTKKTQACIFSRKRNIPEVVELQNVSFKVQPKVKYLGIILDRKMIWKDHIEYIVARADKGYNALRAVNYTTWGADPNIALLMYRSYIRSILDYGCYFYNQAAKTHLQKIDILSNKCLRLCIGALMSTPISNLSVECNEPPLWLRRKTMCEKFITKMITKESIICNNCHKLYINDLTTEYWRKKPTLLLAESYNRIRQFKNKLYTSTLPSMFQINLNNIPNIQPTYMRDYSKFPVYLRNAMFNVDIETLFPEHYQIYTDASKMNSRVAAAVWDPRTRYKEGIRLNENFTTFSAELIAILRAMQYISSINNNEEKFLILTDSKSALLKLESLKDISNYIYIDIIKAYIALRAKGKQISFCWVKAHSNLKHNEIVDTLAKKATEQENESKYKLTLNDVYANITSNKTKTWQQWYNNSTKGLFYKNIQLNIPAKSWFNHYHSEKIVVSYICRLRFGHCLVPEHKFKIGLSDSDLCECGELGSAEHMILNCRLKIIEINQFMNQVYRETNITRPFNLKTILSSLDERVYEILIKHILNIKLKL